MSWKRAGLCLVVLWASACTGLKGSEPSSGNGDAGDAAQGAGGAVSAGDAGAGDGALPGRGRSDASSGLDAAVTDGGAMPSDAEATDGAAAHDAVADGAPDPEPDARVGNVAPNVTIEFPLPGRTDAETITVRGVVHDLDGDAITSVTVNGTAAVVATDSSYSAVVALAPGDNAIEVIAQDILGASSTAATVAIERAAIWSWLQPNDIAIDFGRDRALVVDRSMNAVFSVDLDRGDRIAIADSSVDLGPAFAAPTHIEIDGVNGRAFVLASGALFEINLSTLARTQIPLALGSLSVVDIAYRDGLYAVGGGVLYEIQLPSGQPRVISDDAVAALGPALVAGSALAIHPLYSRAYVARQATDTIKVVDLTDGTRTALAGSQLRYAQAMWVDDFNKRVLVTDGVDDALYAVSMDDGTPSLLSGSTAGSGVPLSPYGFAPYDRRILVANSSSWLFPRGLVTGELTWVDSTTGHRTLLPEGVATGPGLSMPSAAVVDDQGKRLILVDARTAALISIHLGTGNRLVLSDAVAGDGPLLQSPQGIAADLPNRLVFVADTDRKAIFSIDLTTGSRTLASDNDGKGGGTPFSTPRLVLHDSANGRLLVSDGGSVVSIDIAGGTGNRLVLSGSSHQGPALNTVQAIAFGPSPNTLLAFTIDGLVSVDLESGNRQYANQGAERNGFALDGQHWLTFALGIESTPGGDMAFLQLNRIEIATGAAEMVVGPGRGNGPMRSQVVLGAAFAGGLQITRHGRVALISVPFFPGALIAVDLASGDSVLFST